MVICPICGGKIRSANTPTARGLKMKATLLGKVSFKRWWVEDVILRS